MAKVAYISYQLLTIAGEGHTPYHAAKGAGMEFSGGLYPLGPRMLGYLEGDAGDVPQALEAIRAWVVDELTPAEALAWSEESLPVNTQNLEGEYVGPAAFDRDGRIHRSVQDQPW